MPKTGQTILYATGDDGDLEKGVTWPSPRFTDNLNGTVTDNLTGLIWLKNADCTILFSGDTKGQNNRTWSEALTAASSLANGYCGLSDGSSAGAWRLPNVRELQSLVDYGQLNPALPSGYSTYFTGVHPSDTWSSTAYVFKTSTHALCVNLWDGLAEDDSDRTNAYYVWSVRGGQ